MPRLKVTEGFDIDELESAEFTEDGTPREDYEGEIPPSDLILAGYIKKMWFTYTAAKADGTGEDPMLKILFVAEGNEDDDELAEYEGCPFWDNYPLITSAKFKWAPFLRNFGLKLTDVLGPKSKLYVEDEDDNNGAPIEKIASLVPGDDESSWCRIVTAREKYQGNWQARVGQWLPFDAADDASENGSEPDEPEEPATPARGRGARTAAKPTAAKATPTRGGRAAKAAPAKAAAPARGRRGARAAGDDTEPPF
jgi:hypothetical protein